MNTIKNFINFTDKFKSQSQNLPVLFTSHGNPWDIPKSKEERPFWATLYNLGLDLQNSFEINAVLVVSAHWCTKGTYINSTLEQQQIFDYYGFPKEFYEVFYKAKGNPELANSIAQEIDSIVETEKWGLDHGAWPMLMHLFPKANIPVFQLSIDYYAKPEYHYELGKQLSYLRKKGVLIIGSGSLIHNLKLAGEKMRVNDMTAYGWEDEYDEWIKKQIDERNIANIINYENSHPLGKLAAPTPDHFVPVLYSLGLLSNSDDISYFYEEHPTIPAFSERSFVIY